MRRAWAGQELVDGDSIELGQALQAGDGDRPFSALVRAEHGGLELVLRLGLHVLQRETLLTPDTPESFSHTACVVLVHFAFSRGRGRGSRRTC